jgi:hypothetical protein
MRRLARQAGTDTEPGRHDRTGHVDRDELPAIKEEAAPRPFST